MNKISVIVPIYNVKPFLNRCIESILTQSYHNIEIILVDDGSKDGSSEICDAFKFKDSRIIVIHQTNMGLSEARIEGFKVCTGEYVTFVDGDDYVTKDYIAKMAYKAITFNYDLVVCQYFLNEDNNIKPVSRFSEGEYDKEEIYHLLNDKFLFDNKKGVSGFSFYLWNKLIRKDILAKALPHGLGILYVEDMPVTFSVLQQASSLCVIPNHLYYYVQHPNQATKSSKPDLWENYLKCWRKLISLDKDNLLESQLPDRIWFRLSSVIDDILTKEQTYKAFTNRFKEIHEAKDIMNYLYHKKTGNKLKKQMLMIIKYKLYGLFYFYHKLKNPSKVQA